MGVVNLARLGWAVEAGIGMTLTDWCGGVRQSRSREVSFGEAWLGSQGEEAIGFGWVRYVVVR